MRLYVAANNGSVRANKAKYRAKNRETLRRKSKEHYSANREVKLAYGVIWRNENRDKLNKLARDWHRNNPERSAVARCNRRARLMSSETNLTAQQWVEVKTRYEYTCLCCGKKEPEVRLTIDHVVPLSKGGSDSVDNIQPLCWPCNSRKHTASIDYRVDNAFNATKDATRKLSEAVEISSNSQGSF